MQQALPTKLHTTIDKYLKPLQDFLGLLIQTPSVNGENTEEAIARMVFNEANKLDLSAHFLVQDARHPNIYIGDYKNFEQKDGLLFIAHLDTVPVGDEKAWTHNPFDADIVDQKMYGRGAIDNKSGLAVSLYAIKILNELGYQNTAKLVGVADEESGADSLLGAQYVLSEGLNAKAAIYTYPGIETIHIGHRGLVRLNVTFKGNARHTGNIKKDEVVQNPIFVMANFLQQVEQIKLPGDHSAFPNYTFSQHPTLIQGGSAESMLPDTVTVLVDTRLLPGQDSQTYIQRITQLAKSLETEQIQSKVKVKNNIQAVLIEKNEPIVKLLSQLTQETFNKKPKIQAAGPTSEGYMFIQKGIPTVCGFGPVGGNFHAADEYVDLNSLKQLLEIYTRAAIGLQSS